MAWFCGLCGQEDDSEDASERAPLLAGPGDENDNNGNDETARQRRLHTKLHGYQMVRALGQGYLPSTAQTVALLRVLLTELEASPSGGGAQPPPPPLSRAGRALQRETTRWLQQVIALMEHKNGEDQLQDFAWYLSRAHVDVDVDMGSMVQAAERAGAGIPSVRATAATQSLKTVVSLLLTNSEFRLFLADATAVGRDIFRDTAVALSDASRAAAEHVQGGTAAGNPRNPGNPGNPGDALQAAQDNVAAVADEVAAGATKVAGEAAQSATDKLVDNADGARDQLLGRLRQAVARLRQQPDYTQSVSVLTDLLQRCATAYVRAAEQAVEGAVEAVEEVANNNNNNNNNHVATNEEADVALRNAWSFVTAFGDEAAWAELAERFRRLMDRVRGDGGDDGDGDGHARGNRNDRIRDVIRQVSEAVQDLLTDPSFFDHLDERVDALRQQVQSLERPKTASASTSTPAETPPLKDDIAALLDQVQVALAAAARDREVADLARTTGRLVDVLWPSSSSSGSLSETAEQLLSDAATVWVPRLLDTVQHVPIPRLEVATPDVDLLLESVVLEPGRAVHGGSSFLPYRLHAQVRNDVDVYRGHTGTTDAGLQTAATLRLQGLSLAAEDVGYVLRLHAGGWWPPSLLRRWTDEGRASVRVDERGVDVQVDVAVVRGAADTVLALRGVRVTVHRLDYAVHASRAASWVLWLVQPVLRPVLRRTLEQQLEGAVTRGLEGLNRELVMARERLRAARIATSGGGGSNSIQSVVAFVRAVTTRYSSSHSGGDPDTQVTVGARVDGAGVFQGVYAPGSLLQVWDEEARQAQDRIDTYERGGWRNGVFDVL